MGSLHKEESLKSATREKRGKGVRRKVSSQTKLPANFASFLQDSQNKTELFNLISDKVAAREYPQDKAIYITSDNSVISK